MFRKRKGTEERVHFCCARNYCAQVVAHRVNLKRYKKNVVTFSEYMYRIHFSEYRIQPRSSCSGRCLLLGGVALSCFKMQLLSCLQHPVCCSTAVPALGQFNAADSDSWIMRTATEAIPQLASLLYRRKFRTHWFPVEVQVQKM